MTSADKYLLYADDDADDQETLRDLMKSVNSQLSIVSTANGKEALRFLENLSPGDRFPCFIILDMNMPILNGLETLSIIKNHEAYREIPVIIFTTSQHSDEKERARKAEADYFITKPIQLKDLQAVTEHFADLCNIVPSLFKQSG